MKVALLGAPGAEKTKIARRIVRRLNQKQKQWVVIDGYVDRLRDRTGLPFGAASDLRTNLQVLAERWTLEDEAAHKELHSITCGSIYESIIYSAAESTLIPMLEDEQLMVEATRAARTTMEALGILERQTFDYDVLFYLPKDEETHDWDGVVDAKLPEVLEGFFKVAVILTGTDRQKVDRATEIVSNVKTSLYPDQQSGDTTD